MKYRLLKDKVVINTNTGEMLGYICDIEIDLNNYQIKSFIISDKERLISRIFPNLWKRKSFHICLNQIYSIGNDVILVNIDKRNK